MQWDNRLFLALDPQTGEWERESTPTCNGLAGNLLQIGGRPWRTSPGDSFLLGEIDWE